MVSVFTEPNVLDKLETNPLRVVVSYAYLVFSQPPACQAMYTETILHFFNINRLGRTELLDSVYIHQKPRQNFSPPNFKFVNRGCTEKLRNICQPQSVDHRPGIYKLNNS